MYLSAKFQSQLDTLLQHEHIEMYDRLNSQAIPFVIRLITNLLMQNPEKDTNDPLQLIVGDWNQLKLIIPKVKFVNPLFTFQYEQDLYDNTIKLVPSMLLFQKNPYFSGSTSISQIISLLSENKPQFIFSFLGQNNITQPQFNQNLLSYFGNITKYFQKLNHPFFVFLQNPFKWNQKIESIYHKFIQLMNTFTKMHKQEYIQTLKFLFFPSSYSKIDINKFTNTLIEHKHEMDILFIYQTLMQLEIELMDTISSDENADDPTLHDPDYFIQEIKRIQYQCMNKGDPYCECKKCEASKINRINSRENQKRKREVIGELNKLEESYEILKRKVNQNPYIIIFKQAVILEKQNVQFKLILSEILADPSISYIASSAVQEKLGTQINQESGSTYLQEC